MQKNYHLLNMSKPLSILFGFAVLLISFIFAHFFISDSPTQSVQSMELNSAESTMYRQLDSLESQEILSENNDEKMNNQTNLQHGLETAFINRKYY